ncbi:MAG: bifunctional hydroxymethylpyrimidine kinase/phosphomethylpyrimidine kinase [Thermoanaerobaculia bacterium]|nr:bifunctional hydroxymethylpyrimidine kinase/phosphomethylpyrimidine kinase [Thermoanaerobaculia bacterium]
MTASSALAASATDPSGGLLTADLLSFGAFGVAGSGLVTAVTADGLRSPGPVQEIPVALLRAGLESALSARRFTAVKIGIVPSAPAVRAIARGLAHLPAPRVLHPGFAPRSGVRLVRSAALDAFVRDLFPGAALVVLGQAEASALAGFPIREENDVKAAARRVQALGPAAVLVTGGGEAGDRIVVGLLDGRTWHRFDSNSLPAPTDLAAGDRLSAAVTALLAIGETLPDAVARARSWGSGLPSTLYGNP